MRGLHAPLSIVLSLVGGCTELAVVGGGGAGATAMPSGTGQGNGTAGQGAPTGGLTTTGTQSGPSGNGSSASTGVVCVPASCTDADPCTVDTCMPDGSCAHAPRTVGAPGDTAEAACEGVCQVDGTCGLSLYTRDLTTPVWTRRALSEVWSGANAPPPRGIRAADGGISYEAVVVADDGMVYRRVGGAWLAPVTCEDVFDASAAQVTALSGATLFGNEYLFVFFVDGGVNKTHTFEINGGNIAHNTGPNNAQNNDGLRWGEFPLVWSVVVNARQVYYRLDDGNVYETNGGGFVAVPEAMSTILGDPLTSPAPGTIVAGLGRDTEIQLIAP